MFAHAGDILGVPAVAELLAKKFLAVASRPADWRDRGECVQLKNDALLPRRDLSGMPGGAAESPWRPT